VKWPSFLKSKRVIKASDLRAASEMPWISVPKKTIEKEKEVFQLPDRLVALKKNAILVHYKKNAMPRIVPTLSMVADFQSETSVLLDFEVLKAFALRNDFELFELEDRFVVLSVPIFWAKK